MEESTLRWPIDKEHEEGDMKPLPAGTQQRIFNPFAQILHRYVDSSLIFAEHSDAGSANPR